MNETNKPRWIVLAWVTYGVASVFLVQILMHWITDRPFMEAEQISTLTIGMVVGVICYLLLSDVNRR